MGKSTLIKEWARISGLPHTYWVADKDLADVQRRQFYAALQYAWDQLVEVNEWRAHLAIFSRRGYTAEARKLIKEHSILAVDLKQLDDEIA